ncbi:MAG: hypothetical protein ABIU54_13145 [Candidatus Eisenbacteria bacterium]
MAFDRRALALLAALIAVGLGVGVEGANAAAPKGRTAKPFGVQRPVRVTTTDQSRRIDVNEINMFVTNNGSFAYDLGAGDSGLFWPKGTDKSLVFASGLWLGAKVLGEVRTVVAEYSQEYGPGIILPDGSADDPTRPQYIVYKVVRFNGDPADTGHVELPAPDALSRQDNLVHHSWSEYMAGAVPYGAPWRLYHLPDTSTPAEGDSVDVPGPDVIGDQMLWTVYNDADPSLHTNDAGGSAPLGIEIQQTTFAFNRQGALGKTLFIKYKLKNKGTQTLNEMYISQWADPDLGGSAGFTDDLVGSDTLPDGTGKPRSLGFVYNSTNNDGGYGSKPPALGYDFFQGPRVGAAPLPLTSFAKYINGTDPASSDETYNYMQGLAADGSDVVDPFGVVTKFMHAGDPVSPTPGSWLDTNPADRRFFLSSGPFTMAPGDSQEVVVGIVVGAGNDRLSSISSLRFNDEFAQDAFDRNFDLPSPPSQPKVTVSEDHNEITLSWDAQSRTGYTQEGYAFEGYNVYQGESVAGPWKRIATYDEINGVRVVTDRYFDPTTGQLIQDYPVAFGSDAGVRFQYVATQDFIRGGPLHDGTEYYYAVTAYSYNPTGLPKILENAQAVVRAIPQRSAAGTDLGSASATDVLYLQKDTTKPPSTDVVSVEVVNPELVTGDIYKVVFEAIVPPYVGPIGTIDSTTIYYSWSLIDSTTGAVKFSGQLNRNGDDDYRVVDGLRVKVTGKYAAQFQDALYRNLNTAHRRALEGVNFGLAAFGGGAGPAIDFQGSSLDPAAMPDSFTSVQLRFGTTTTQNAYRYMRLQTQTDGSAPNGDREYRYGGYHQVNVQAWDVITNRQLDLAFVERLLTDDFGAILPASEQPSTNDSTWAPSDEDAGGREYLLITSRPYSAAPKAEFQVDGFINGGSAPLLYALTAKKRTAADIIDNGDAFDFIWANPAKDNDVYVFDTQKLQQNNSGLAKSRLERIRAVPNPYYAHSTYELNQFGRKVRFLNMPERCTVRIFNLAGQLVRTLDKSDASTSVLEWDLQTRNDLPVGSGVYIFHVEVPGVGEHIGRLVIFMEKERLNSF